MIAYATDIFNDDLLCEVIEIKSIYQIELKYIIGYMDFIGIFFKYI